jgi:hypothetical protein
MRIGLDLDGTIVVYDAIFHRLATSRFRMPSDVPVRKESVRDWLRSLRDGEAQWIELQGLVYGPLMEEAPPAPGVLEFLHDCRRAEIAVSIVSHRTAVAVADPSVDLHAAARGWLERRDLADRVFLETSRAAKLVRIGHEGCALFVDDLPDVFAEPDFPAATERWLYAPGGRESVHGAIRPFSDWSEVLCRAVELQGAEHGG